MCHACVLAIQLSSWLDEPHAMLLAGLVAVCLVLLLAGGIGLHILTKASTNGRPKSAGK